MAMMTSHERFEAMYEHRPADRVPIIDGPWGATIERWRREGLPEGVDWQDYFGVDRVVGYRPDNSPLYPKETLEETAEYTVTTTQWGQTIRNWKHSGGTPEFLKCSIVDPDSWAKAKKRMTPSPDRIDWDYLKANYPRWRERGTWIEAGLWFGFDVTHSWMVGTERLLMALATDPEWCMDIFGTCLSTSIALLEMVIDAGYTFDSVMWYDDLGYKHHQFMSMKMYRELLKPYHARACEWAHSRRIHTHLHSCGDVNPFVPEFIEIGIECLNPLEVKAGMDPVALKGKYEKDLVFHGGINAVLWTDFDKLAEEMRRVVPIMKAGGGYIFGSDHSVPSSVSLETFGKTIELAKELGRYD